MTRSIPHDVTCNPELADGDRVRVVRGRFAGHVGTVAFRVPANGAYGTRYWVDCDRGDGALLRRASLRLMMAGDEAIDGMVVRTLTEVLEGRRREGTNAHATVGIAHGERAEVD